MSDLSQEERERLEGLITERATRYARADSSAFVDRFFGYTSAPFQQDWHFQWNRPSAQVVQWSPIEHGKTQQITGWALWKLGRDPVNTRILWVGSAQTAGKKSTGVIKEAIENPTPFLRRVFPELVPGRKWTQSQFSVRGAKVTEKDYSVETVGVDSQILGGRFTDIILDDICTFGTTFTSDQRKKVTDWFFSTVLGRLLEGGRVICVGNAWYPDDVMHALADRGFTVIRNEAYRETEDGDIVPGSVLWPEQWSLDRLRDKRKILGSIEAKRQLRCAPYTPGEGRFQMEWFDWAMEAGRGLHLLERYSDLPTFLGVDLGISEKEGSDPTSFWCMGVDPKTQKRRLVATFEERINGPQTIQRLKDYHERYAPSTMVENNAAQDFIRQFAGEVGIPTRPFTTGKNKADPSFGVPSLGVELEQRMWILPTGDDESIKAAIRWRTQCLAFAPGQHAGDTLMASWFAREACRSGVGMALAVEKAAPAENLSARYGRNEGGLFGRRTR